MEEKRGQAAIEYVVLVGTLLIFLIPVVYYSMTQSSFHLKVSQLDHAAKRLAKASDAVYALSPGAQDVVIVTLPHGIEGVTVGPSGVHFNVSIFGGFSDFGYATVAPLTGTVPILPGTYRILLIHNSEGYVNVSLKP